MSSHAEQQPCHKRRTIEHRAQSQAKGMAIISGQEAQQMQ
jgi:hypothetical protein